MTAIISFAQQSTGILIWLAFQVAFCWVSLDGIEFVTSIKSLWILVPIWAFSGYIPPLAIFWIVCGLISYVA